jgi:hypothetical protein
MGDPNAETKEAGSHQRPPPPERGMLQTRRDRGATDLDPQANHAATAKAFGASSQTLISTRSGEP